MTAPERINIIKYAVNVEERGIDVTPSNQKTNIISPMVIYLPYKTSIFGICRLKFFNFSTESPTAAKGHIPHRNLPETKVIKYIPNMPADQNSIFTTFNCPSLCPEKSIKSVIIRNSELNTWRLDG